MAVRSHRVRSWSLEQHEATGRIDASGAARIGEEHQREQPGDLRVGREQHTQHPRELEAALGEVGASEVLARWRRNARS